MKLDGNKVRKYSFKDLVERKCKCVVGEMFVVGSGYTNTQTIISELIRQHDNKLYLKKLPRTNKTSSKICCLKKELAIDL